MVWKLSFFHTVATQQMEGSTHTVDLPIQTWNGIYINVIRATLNDRNHHLGLFSSANVLLNIIKGEEIMTFSWSPPPGSEWDVLALPLRSSRHPSSYTSNSPVTYIICGNWETDEKTTNKIKLTCLHKSSLLCWQPAYFSKTEIKCTQAAVAPNFCFLSPHGSEPPPHV